MRGVTTTDSVEQTAHANAWGICIDQSFTADAAGGSLIDAHANATERGCTSWTELCASRRAAGARECARDDGLCACDCASVGGVVAAAMDAGTALVGVALVLVLLRGAASLEGSESRHGRVAALVALVAALAAFGAGFGEFYAACYVGGVRHAAWGGGEIRFGSHHTAASRVRPQTLALGTAATLRRGARRRQPRPRVPRRAATESRRRPARRAGPAAPVVAGARGARPRAGLVGAAHDLERPARLAAERKY